MHDVRKFLRMYKGLVLSSVMFLFTILGFIFGIIPAVDKVMAIRDEVSHLRTQTQQLREKAAILTAIDEETYKKYLTELITAVPADQSLTSLFSTIDGIGDQTGILLTDLSLTKPGELATSSGRKQSIEEKEIGTNLLPFAVTITGSYDQIQMFLEKVIKVRRFFRVRGFELSLLDPTNVTVRMKLDAFYAPHTSTIGGVDTKIETLTQKDEEIIATVATLPIVGNQSPIFTAQVSSDSIPIIPKEDPFAP